MRHPEPDPKLADRVRADLRPLFDNGAQLLFSKRLPGVGNSHAILRVLEIELWITESGGSISVLASPSPAGDSWNAVEFLLRAIEPEGTLPPNPVYGSLAELGRLLESRLQRLNDALTPEHFAATVQAARQATMQRMIALKPRAAVRPPRRGIGPSLIGGIVKLIRVLTPKPKNRRTKFLPIGSDVELERQVRDEFEAAFRNFGAQIYSNGRVRMMDFATVTFDAGNLRIRASRDRGSIDVSVAPLHAVRIWHGLGIALRTLQEDRKNVQAIPSSMLNGAGSLLEKEFLNLSEAFSEANFPAVQKRMSEIEDGAKQSWIEEFNRKSKVYQATTP
jgi:hypothetical protein